MSPTRPLILVLAAALGLLAVTVAARAAEDAPAAQVAAPWLDLRAQQPIHGDAEAGKARATVCAACHGAKGLSIAPTYPDLAGQSATYLYVQLKAFKGGQRSGPIMRGMVATLSDSDMRNLAAWYASLPPQPPGHPDATTRGSQLYLHGDPARGIPPCQGCHGPAGKGPRVYPDNAPHPPWSTFPKLHSQPSQYIAGELQQFRSGARNGTSNARIMQGVAQTLDDSDIQALAAWIESQ